MKVGSKEYKKMAEKLHREIDEISTIRYVVNAHYLRDYKIHIKFNTGEEGVVDLEDTVGGKGVFKPLKDLKNFRQVEFSPELDTICWPNGADLAPEYLYSKLCSDKLN